MLYTMKGETSITLSPGQGQRGNKFNNVLNHNQWHLLTSMPLQCTFMCSLQVDIVKSILVLISHELPLSGKSGKAINTIINSLATVIATAS